MTQTLHTILTGPSCFINVEKEEDMISLSGTNAFGERGYFPLTIDQAKQVKQALTLLLEEEL